MVGVIKDHDFAAVSTCIKSTGSIMVGGRELSRSIRMAINLAGCACDCRKHVSHEDVVVVIRPCALRTTSHWEITNLVAEFRGNPRHISFSYGAVLAKTSLKRKHLGNVFIVTRHFTHCFLWGS